MMRDIDLFQQALGLEPPWRVVRSEFNLEKRRLDIFIDFPKGATFTCPACGEKGLTAYDTQPKTWRHLNFFQHEAYLTARVPRVHCEKCGATRLVEVPWARKGSGFTLLFEAMIMMLAKAMPVRSIADMVGEHDTRLWRILHYYVEQALEAADYSEVAVLGIDETASKRGHDYVSLFVDLEVPRVVYVTEGKEAATVKRFKEHLMCHGGDAEKIRQVCCDMSPAFMKGITENFPNASITFDKFHVMKILNEAVDQVRREEQRRRPELKKTRYLWLKNPGNLKKSQGTRLRELRLRHRNLKTNRAYHLRLNFQEFFKQPLYLAEKFLKEWYFWATHSRLEPMKQAAYTIKRHWQGVLQWFKSRISNGILEGINSLIQAAKARARGYRTTRNFITMIYLIGGKLNFNLPT